GAGRRPGGGGGAREGVATATLDGPGAGGEGWRREDGGEFRLRQPVRCLSQAGPDIEISGYREPAETDHEQGRDQDEALLHESIIAGAGRSVSGKINCRNGFRRFIRSVHNRWWARSL